MSLFNAVDKCSAADIVPEIVASESGANFGRSDIGANASGLTAIFSNSRLFIRSATGWKQNIVNPTPTYAYCGTVLVDNGGTTHVFYSGNYNGTGPLLHAEFSPDLPNGASSPPAETVATSCTNSAIEDADGNIHLVYVQGSFLYYRVRSIGTWSTPQQIYTSGYYDAVVLRLGSDGRTLHMVAQQRSSYYSIPIGLHYGTKPPAGNWIFETAVPNIQSYGKLSLAVDGQSPYILYYEYFSETDSRVKMARRNADGMWTLEYLFTGAKGGIQGMDSDVLNGTLFVVFSAGSGSSDDSRPWMIKKTLPDGPVESQAIAERLGYGDTPSYSALPAITVGAGSPSASYNYNLYRLKAVMDLSNNAPVVNAGSDQSVVLNAQVNLNGVALDADSDPLTSNWVLTDPVGSTASFSGLTLNFTASLSGIYSAVLTVSDDRGGQRSDSVLVFVDGAPAINLPSPQSVALDGGYYYIASAVDASGTQYILSGGKLYKKTITGWVSTPVNPVQTKYPQILIGGNGNIHLFYSQLISGNYHNIHVECEKNAPDQSPTCGAGEDVPTRPADQPYNQLTGRSGVLSAVEDIDGHLHLVYAYFSGYWGLFHTVRVNSVWSQPIRVNPTIPTGGVYMSVTDVSLRLDPDGRTLHVAYTNFNAFETPTGIYYGRKGPADTNWSSEPVEQDIYSYVVGLAMDGATPQVVYSTPDYTLKMATRKEGGAWNHQYLAMPVGYIEYLNADTAGGKLHVLYSAGNGSYNDYRPLYVTKDLQSGVPSVKRILDGNRWNWTQVPDVAVAPMPGGSGVLLAYNFNSTNIKTITILNYPDDDGDGYTSNIDCNDGDATINPGALDIICNGIDNNCNGIADDGYMPSSTVCGYGVCVATGQMNCVNGQTLDTCTPEQPAGVDNNCNGIDEDCTGVVDDGYVSPTTTCGVGVCAATGQLICVAGQTQDTCTAGQPIGTDDNCNSIDEDCSGVADDGYVPSNTTCGVGVCGTTGQLVCVAGQTQDTCTPGQPTGADDNCNGMDEDCSGVADDGYVPSSTSCGEGVCGATGQLICVSGQTQNTCTPELPTGADDNCNGIDEDCSGVADDGYVPTATSCGLGVCGATGQLICVAGQTQDICTAGQPTGADDNCNGIDEDCSGLADDGYVPTLTSCGLGVCGASGQLICVAGQTQDTCTSGQPTGNDDNCNGIDEDCSGVADDAYVPTATSCGEGVCGATGQLICVSGQTQNTCTPGLSTGADDNCNGIDEDCNGATDDGYTPPLTSCGVGVCGATGQLVCVDGQTQDTCTAEQPTGTDNNCNGIDEDCSGTADDGYVSSSTSCGEGVCGATGQLICMSGQTQNTCTPGLPTGADDNCNGIDEDCSGVADDSYVPTSTSCGDGVCGATGQLVCVNGQTQDTCTMGQPTGADDNCNGIDEDCNGASDDGYAPSGTSCGVGVCGTTGQLVCVAGQTQDTCTPGQPTGADDNCNSIDEDCSGVADDDYVPTATSCGVGVCGTTGQLVCVAGQIQDTCIAGQPQTEGPVGDLSCNDTMDNDCDGNIDLSDPACINTPSGQDVTTQPVDETTGTTPVDVNFSDVDANGITTLTTSGVGAPPPLGFKIGTPPTYYEISTTASYSGQIEVCINYSAISYANESTLKLFHHNNNIWEDITFSLDTVTNIICGVTTSLSPFAIFEFYNKPPAAEAGADLSLACLEMICPVILDGSGSTDPNSAPGTQDDIASYEWYINYGEAGELLLVAGRTISYDLPLGEYQITLVVTDMAGVQAQDNIFVRVNPSQLSLLEITKAEVEWEKAGERPNRVKIHGRVAMPVGKDYYQVNPSGKVILGISTATNAINQNVVFQVKGDYGSKWEYKTDPTGIGISKYEIDWQGAKFDYNRDIRLKSNHLGSNSTTLEIDRKDIAEAIVISVSDITIHIDSTGAVSAVPESIKVDIDDDGEIEVELPFALAMNTAFSVTHGTASYTIKVGDYYSAAVGKFELMGRFDPNGLNGTVRPATLDIGITFGNQGFPGMFHILDGGWAQLKNVEWKYKK